MIQIAIVLLMLYAFLGMQNEATAGIMLFVALVVHWIVSRAAMASPFHVSPFLSDPVAIIVGTALWIVLAATGVILLFT